ncbi:MULTISPECIES: MinD/ParA family protein [Bacillaceae]|uniref:MinD/ParA family protein n=1 Tax=Evansella alkalicola TaxID=745819 RepID=A0ABS6JP45_9BACI|nr:MULTISPECIES: MinD/ParA family protein [Bacillaceae]MBU9720338.1 MinD/ParA family protein [Bacillus alkalicola]
MHDQAAILRNKMKDFSNPPESINTKVIAVASGKGGVGKSSFTINFALALQEKNKKVLIIDLDIGMANVDIMLGLSATYSIVDMLEGSMPIHSIISSGPAGISFISGGSGLNELFQMDELKKNFFLQQLAMLSGYEYILFDLGAGVTKDSLQFLMSAHEVFIITTPDPTSVTDAYGLIKYLHHEDKDIPLFLVVNRVRTKKEGQATANSVSRVCEQFLNKNINYLISIPEDDAVWKGVRSQSPFVLISPRAASSVAIFEAVNRFLYGNGNEIKETSLTGFVTKLKSFFYTKGR